LASQKSFSELNFLDSEAKCGDIEEEDSDEEPDDNYPGFEDEQDENEDLRLLEASKEQANEEEDEETWEFKPHKK
jgi:hypothetical protein